MKRRSWLTNSVRSTSGRGTFLLSKIALEEIRGAPRKLATSTGTPCRRKERAIGTMMRGIKPRIRTGRFTGTLLHLRFFALWYSDAMRHRLQSHSLWFHGSFEGPKKTGYIGGEKRMPFKPDV